MPGAGLWEGELMDFSDALRACIKDKKKITRLLWGGHHMYVVYREGYPDGIPINASTARSTGMEEGTVCRFRPYLLVRAGDGEFVPWVASQGDLLAQDWELVDESTEQR